MLNPFAHDFTPIGFSPESKKDPPPPLQPVKKQDQQQQSKKKPSNAESKKPARSQPQPQPQPRSKKTTNVKSSESFNSKRKDLQANSNGKKPTSTTARDQPKSNRNRRKSSHHDVAATSSSFVNQFSQETKFIAIEAAIDPIHRIDNTTTSANVNTNNRRQSVVEKSQKFEHGYERYTDWIDRSLRLYDTVTMVGMDNAIVDVVSLVTILYDRKIAAHDDIETFTMNPGNGRMTSCIQVKLHPIY